MCGVTFSSVDGARVVAGNGAAPRVPTVAPWHTAAKPAEAPEKEKKNSNGELQILYDSLAQYERMATNFEGEVSESAQSVVSALKDRIEAIKKEQADAKPRWQVLQATAGQLQKVRSTIAAKEEEEEQLTEQLDKLRLQRATVQDDLVALRLRERELATICEVKQEELPPQDELAWLDEMPVYANMAESMQKSPAVLQIRMAVARQLDQLKSLAQPPQVVPPSGSAGSAAAGVGGAPGTPLAGGPAGSGDPTPKPPGEEGGDDAMGGGAGGEEELGEEEGESTKEEFTQEPPPDFEEILRKRVGQELSEDALKGVAQELAAEYAKDRKKPRLG